MRLLKNILLPLLLSTSALTANAADDFDGLKQAIAGKHRAAESKARDKYRHPEQTLEFFEVKNDLTVVEIWPGNGWYTEILAPYLKTNGKFIAAQFSPNAELPYHKNTAQKYIDKLKSQPNLYGKVELSVLEPPEYLQIGPDNSVDRILTFRNVHNWMKDDQAAAVFKAMFTALKPGGILGVVEHRSNNLKQEDPKAASGYVSEDYVIALARNAGFEFLAKSEINANSKDTKDYPEGVWVLPPALSGKDKDRKKYLSIGESDRMTIKFIKPTGLKAALFGNGLSRL
ncbi:MAG: methyltransferase [Methylococcaceae bacterium]|nr:methyltransferase [Methylococcaceae bacterium]MDZ4155877.1 methyltransferase [Methylococcales bacterium]MDP2391774.1 methyltransferase [Methylococcaceae bacterium]MDP3018987.1 methyltransferase [Methylococcaceae bacterium]MDP3391548.1 methyltransferase [Methylococcaceae bacterium]